MPGSRTYAKDIRRVLLHAHIALAFTCTICGAEAEDLAVSGRIESYETSINVAIPGRIKQVFIHEGDQVKKGQLVLQLDDEEIQARLRGIQTVLQAAQQQQAQAKDWLQALKRELTKAMAASAAPKAPPVEPSRPPGILAKAELKGTMTASAMHNDGTTPRVLAVSAHTEILEQPADQSIATLSLNAQLSALDEALKFEQSTIDEAYQAQKKALDEAFKAKRSALEDGFKTKCNALEEGYKLKVSTFKGGILSTITGANKAKHYAADEIYKAKKAALEDGYKTRCAAIDEAEKADSAALEQAIKAKRSAVDETFKTKRQALTQVAETEAVMERTMKDTQSTFKAELSKLQSGLSQKLSSASSGPAASIGETLRAAQLSNLRLQLNQVEESIAVAETEVAKAKAVKEEILAKSSYFKVRSPIDGTCARSNINAGEVAAPGQALLTIVDLSNVYLRAFVPEGSIGKVKIGQSAQVYLDSLPQKALNAKVVAIDTQASFTPENIYFKDDRVRQVFGVKLRIENPGGLAKPGMPADGKVIVGDGRT